MPRVQLEVDLPHDSLVTFSIKHPNDEFWMLTAHRTDDSLQVVVDARTHDSAALLEALEEASEVHSYEVLHNDQQGVLFQLETSEHTPRTAARAAGMLPQYPMMLCNGKLTIETIISWERLSRLKSEFEQADISYEVLSISRSVEMTDLLTERQWDVLTEAIECGYYDTPRGCSLTDLAAALDVNPSAVSGVLHRAEERIIKAFVADVRRIGEYS